MERVRDGRGKIWRRGSFKEMGRGGGEMEVKDTCMGRGMRLG